MTTTSFLPHKRRDQIIAQARKITRGEVSNFSREIMNQIKLRLDEIDAMDRRHFTRKRGIRFFHGDYKEFNANHDLMVRRIFGLIVGVDSPSPAEPACQLPATQSAPVSTKRVTDADRLSQLNRDLKARHAANRSKS